MVINILLINLIKVKYIIVFYYFFELWKIIYIKMLIWSFKMIKYFILI